MPTGTEFAQKAQTAIADHWGYIWGECGAIWTEAKQAAARREMTVKYGKKWIGHHVADCSGLVVWVCKQYGIPMYHGSHTMYVSDQYLKSKGELQNGARKDGKALAAGSLVFEWNGSRYYHVGIYAGGGTVIEAQGTQAGCVRSSIRSGWTHWGEIRGVDYSLTPEPEPDPPEPDPPVRPTLRRGSKGDLVVTLQQMLEKSGYSPGKIDGIFGANTEQAVKDFQAAHGLDADGICGRKTWAALDSAAPLETWQISISGATWAQYKQILAICPTAEATREVD